MELGSNIKKYRNAMNWSQDELADKVFVSRQTVSNWENDKNYPDIKSLILLSEVFGISLDNLVKGDIVKMKEQINSEEIERFRRDGNIYTILLLAMIITPIPLVHFFRFVGISIWAFLGAMTLMYAAKIEKQKKYFDIQTYKEIVAFTEGKSLDDIEKARESGKRPYQKILLAVGAGAMALVVAVVMTLILK